MQRLFFDLHATQNPHRWFPPVEPAICIGPPANSLMFGGVGMASVAARVRESAGDR
jgi:acyl-CoA thioesterase II